MITSKIQRECSTLYSQQRGGKKQTNLMAKRRKCRKQLTAEHKIMLNQLLPKRKALAKARDGAVKEKKDLSDKLNGNIQAR